jgi:hypothetical protein
VSVKEKGEKSSALVVLYVMRALADKEKFYEPEDGCRREKSIENGTRALCE